MRFLHLADLHLDTPFAGRDAALRERLRDATYEALDRAVEQALSRKVDAVLIAGDLFDGERLSFPTERRLLQALGRLVDANIQVLYATGNHDPGGPGGAPERIVWPDGVTVFPEPEPRRVPVRRRGEVVGWVTGAGHASPREERDLSRAFPSPTGPEPEVALLHTQVLGATGAGSHDRYAPSELSRLRRSGHDYWALGHIHRPQALSSQPPIHYPGSLQGRHPGETGPHGGLLVELEPGGAAGVEFLELAPVRWERLEVDGLDDATHLDALVQLIARHWKAARSEDPAPPGTEWALRLELRGGSPLFSELQMDENLAELRHQLQTDLDLLWVELRTTGVHPPLDPAEHRDRSDVLGEGLRLLERLRTSDAATAEMLDIAPEELVGLDEADADAYLKDLLHDCDAELLAALLREGT